MKKNLIISLLVASSVYAIAQTDTSNKSMSPPNLNNTKDGMNLNNDKQYNQNIQINPDSGHNRKASDISNPDALIMENGKMMMQIKGKMTPMTYAIVLNDGTKVLNDGTCIKKNGTKMMLHNGERIDLEGKIVSGKNVNNMYLIPDTMQK